MTAVIPGWQFEWIAGVQVCELTARQPLQLLTHQHPDGAQSNETDSAC